MSTELYFVIGKQIMDDYYAAGRVSYDWLWRVQSRILWAANYIQQVEVILTHLVSKLRKIYVIRILRILVIVLGK